MGGRSPVSWFRLDDNGAFHKKVVAAGNEAYGAWCRAGQWCSAQLNDGLVPWDIALTIGPRKLWDRLLKVRLCDPVDDEHIQIHDFNEYNPKGESVRAERARKARNVADYRARRVANGTTNVTEVVSGDVTAPSPVTRPVSNRPRTTARPDPVPSRSRTRSETTPDLRLVPDALPAKSDHAELLATYSAAYEHAKGVKPIIEGRNGKAAKELLKKLSLTEAQDMVRRAFADEFFSTNQCELWQIANAPNKWRGNPKATRNGQLVQQPAKDGEYRWDDDLSAETKGGAS